MDIDGFGAAVQFPNEKDEPGLTGRAKKRKWFQERYNTNGNGSRVVKPKIVCKFYSSTGRCRNGSDCQFVHDDTARVSQHRVIQEPCKFLYTLSRVCGKGDQCHFSHDLHLFKCPELFGKKFNKCASTATCGFDHSPIANESEAMQFARMYEPYLNSLLSGELNKHWDKYIRHPDEYEILESRTHKSASNLFNVPVGYIAPR